jgi:stage V sporulation protein B
MAMPVLTFLTCLPAAVAELLVPELTALQVRRETARLRATAERLLRLTLGFSMLAGAFFYVTADALGALIYRSAESAKYIRLFAPMVPLIYTDIVTDGCLKGLGEMMRSMAYNIAEAALGLVLVRALLPRWALGGYIATMYIGELFNFALSLGRLKKVLKL